MKTEEQLNKDIRKITTKIREDFPELSKYLNERPIDYSVNPGEGVNRKSLEKYYNSLKELVEGYAKEKSKMETLKMESQKLNNMKQVNKDQNFPGYPETPSSEDVYKKWMEETELNPENTSRRKVPVGMPGNKQDHGYSQVKTGRGLDVPGSKMDNAREKIGSEDEENNYYSIGGDKHKNLEESKGLKELSNK